MKPQTQQPDLEKKEQYIKEWTEYTKGLYTLAFCSNDDLSKEVTDCIKRIEKVIPKIAETKKWGVA